MCESGASSSFPAASTSASDPRRPASWTDAGSPSSAGPQGSASAGQPRALNGNVLEISPFLTLTSPGAPSPIRGATRGSVGVRTRSKPSSALSTSSAVLRTASRGALRVGFGHLQAALDLEPNVLAVEIGVLSDELAVHVCHLAVEERVDSVGSRERHRAMARQRARLPRARARERAARRRRSTRRRPRALRASRARTTRNRGRARASAASHVSTSRAIGPAWSKLGASGKQPSSDTSPYVGLKPTTPQQAAGMRMEPPESVPSATSAASRTSAAALPPLEPPATRPGASGFGTTPKCGFSEVVP